MRNGDKSNEGGKLCEAIQELIANKIVDIFDTSEEREDILKCEVVEAHRGSHTGHPISYINKTTTTTTNSSCSQLIY